MAHGLTPMTPSVRGYETFPTPTLGSLGPSHKWRHKSQVSFQDPLVHMVLRALLMERCTIPLDLCEKTIRVGYLYDLIGVLDMKYGKWVLNEHFSFAPTSHRIKHVISVR